MDEVAQAREWMLPEEAVPIRLMATVWSDVAGVHDDLGRVEDLAAWLSAVDLDHAGSKATATELALAHRLRDALRRLAAQVTGDARAAARSATGDIEAAVRDLNEVVAYLPAPRIALADGALRATSTSSSSPITAA